MKSIYATILGPSSRNGTEGPPYLPRALALWTSIVRHNKVAEFAFFCIDDRAAELLETLALPRTRVYREAAFACDLLRSLRGTRSIAEYCWTAKSFALGCLLDGDPSLDWAVYLDADMLAFGDPDIALDEAGAADFLLTPHRFAREFASFASVAGSHNAGYVAFRNTTVGKAAVARWRDLCVEFCPAVATAQAFADQRYLDRLLTEFPTGTGSAHVGLNAGPWNIGQYLLTSDTGNVYLNSRPLLLYHFQSLRVFGRQWLDLYFGGRKLPRNVRDLIYVPYVDALARSYGVLRNVAAIDGLGTSPLPPHLKHWLSYGKAVALGKVNLYRYPLWT
jgi:hypothetical protein